MNWARAFHELAGDLAIGAIVLAIFAWLVVLPTVGLLFVSGVIR